MPLLEIKNLTVEFGEPENAARAVDQVSLAIEPGETLCLVGESGCGKSVTAMSIARLVPTPPARYVEGEIWLNGKEILRLSKSELRQIRGRVVSFVFQDPSSSLNPVFRIGHQILESLRLHRPEAATESEVIRLLKWVGIPAPELRMRDYPHQLSGGMQQRVMIAMALASHPDLLVADEPTTALDVTIQAQILDLLRELRSQIGLSVLLITHNLALVSEIGDRAAVMYAGQIVEIGPARDLVRTPLHPYTRALIDSVPKLGNPGERLRSIPGTVPQLGRYPNGCRFHLRCPVARPDCSSNEPALLKQGSERWVRCPYFSL